jgi:hypothetical protein
MGRMVECRKTRICCRLTDNITTDFSSQQALKLLDELELNYHALYELTVYYEYYLRHKYQFDAYIDLNVR